MYEFRYPKVAELSVEKIQQIINQKVESLEKEYKEKESSLSLGRQLLFSSNINHVKSGFNVSLNMKELSGQEFDFSVVDNLIQKSKELGLPLYFFVTGCSNIGSEESTVTMSFTQTDIDNLIELNNYLVEKGENSLFFMEDSHFPNNSWTFEEVITANSQIDELVNYIKENNFSPFEAATFIHEYITTQFEYKDNLFDPMTSRSIIGTLNSDEIVCVGYSSLTKAIIDKLNMPGLKCSTFSSRLKRTGEANEILKDINMEEEVTGHMQNLITIDDPKYYIKGTYVSDSCWDSKNENYPYGKGIANFMYPVEDLLHLRGLEFTELSEEVDKINAMYKMIGLNKKIDPYSYPVINNNIKNSKPIEYEKYRAALKEVIKKMTPKKKLKYLDEHIDEIMQVTEMTSFLVFDKNAIGSIATKAHEEIQREIDKLEETEQITENTNVNDNLPQKE